MEKKAAAALGIFFAMIFLFTGITSYWRKGYYASTVIDVEDYMKGSEKEACAYYKGVCYTSDYKELIEWPAGTMVRKIKANGGVITPDMFHPNVEVIRSGSFNKVTGVITVNPLRSGKERAEKIEGLKMVIFPWGVTHVYDAVGYAINVVPDTVVEAPSSNDGVVRGLPVYMSYPMNSTRREPLGLAGPSFEDICLQFPWYTYYDIHAGWNAMPNGRAYYLVDVEVRENVVEPYIYRGWHEIDGVRCYFDDNGALTEAELAEGLYEFDGVSLLVDAAGRVSLPEGWQKIGGKWRRFDENGAEERGAFVGLESWLRGLWG